MKLTSNRASLIYIQYHSAIHYGLTLINHILAYEYQCVQCQTFKDDNRSISLVYTFVERYEFINFLLMIDVLNLLRN